MKLFLSLAVLSVSLAGCSGGHGKKAAATSPPAASGANEVASQADERWTPIAATARKKISVRSDSISPHGEYLQAWSRYYFKDLQTDMGQPYRVSKYLSDYDCKGGRTKPLRVLNFNGPLETHNMELEETGWLPADDTDTVNGALLEAVCAETH